MGFLNTIVKITEVMGHVNQEVLTNFFDLIINIAYYSHVRNLAGSDQSKAD